VNARTFNRKREKNVGIAERIVIEEVPRMGLEIREVQCPAANWNGDAEFALLVGLAA